MMDNSSRNIVKFIATITAAALLIMGARFYAQSQMESKPEVAEEVTTAEATPVEVTDDPLAETEDAVNPEADPQNPEEEIIEEDAELIMGEPSMNLEDGGTTIYLPQTPPPADTAAPVEQ